ncbi:hypothetical protein [Thermus sp.]|uniref:hypothetical protein n=1 Tax=Thermus sp. TaxID=275 RepID=UPI00307E6D25
MGSPWERSGFPWAGAGPTSKGPSPSSPASPQVPPPAPPGSTYLLVTQAAERAFGIPPGLQRALGLKGVLLVHGLRLQVVRGYEPLRFGGE